MLIRWKQRGAAIADRSTLMDHSESQLLCDARFYGLCAVWCVL